MFIQRFARLLSATAAIRPASYALSSRQINTNESTTTNLKLKSITDTHATLLLNGKEYKFDWIFLRDSCQCPQCVDTSTTQKLLSTTDIPMTISPKKTGIQVLDNNVLEITWNQPLLNEKQQQNADGHRSLFTSNWLRNYSTPENIARSRYNARPLVLWNREIIEKANLNIDFNEYFHTDEGLYTALKHLNDYGIVFVNSIPKEVDVEHLCERIGPLRDTFYGRLWNVRSVQQPINIAYNSSELGLHMDLLYFEFPAGLQYLHVLANDAQGGESFYGDAFYAAEILRQQNAEAFDILCRYPVPFHFRNNGRHFHINSTIIVLDKFSPDKRIHHMSYGPPFQGPFETNTSDPEFRMFIRALHQLRNIIEDKKNQYELKLEKNQCVIFNNRRILHARRAFDLGSGDRWLRGCYTDLDNFKDRLRVLQEKLEPVQC